MPCIASVCRMAPEVFGSLRLSGCEEESDSAATEPSVPCWPKVSGDGSPCCEKRSYQHNGGSAVRSSKSSLAFHR